MNLNANIRFAAAFQGCCYAFVGLICLGCQAAKPAVIAPPDSFQNRPTSYYTPAFGTAPANNNPPSNNTAPPISLAPDGVKTGANNSLVPSRPGSPLAPVSAGDLPTKTASAIPDTYDVTVRIPQDNQPIRVLERGIANVPSSNGFAPRVATSGMTVNDGTRATAWGQPTRMQPLPFGDPQARPVAGISMAGLRGANDTPIAPSRSGNFSSQDGQWKSRGSYESTDRR